MPIYLVRWPHAKASLVTARNEEELRLILSEVADPSSARWSEYKGPFWLDVELPTVASPEQEGATVIDAAAVVEERAVPLAVRFGATESGQAMREVVARWTLPNLQAIVDALGEEKEAELSEPIARRWRERVVRAVATDEAEMTIIVHRRIEREEALRGPARPVNTDALRMAVARIAEQLVRKSSGAPKLTLVRSEEE